MPTDPVAAVLTATDAASRPPAAPPADAPPPALSLEDVGYAPPGHPPVLAGIRWSLPAGGFHAVLGRSGCGKTTLLRLAAGLLLPDAGAVRVAGRTLRGPAEAVGFAFQAPTLLDWLSALDNVLLPLSLRGRVGAGGRARALSLLSGLGLAGLERRRPAQLSGGQQARVALARALVDSPRLLLLDEPFAALDALTREALQADLAALCARENIAALMVTHDIAEAAMLADRVAVMAPGRIAEAVEVLLPRPRPPGLRYEAGFVGHCRALRAALDRAA